MCDTILQIMLVLPRVLPLTPETDHLGEACLIDMMLQLVTRDDDFATFVTEYHLKQALFTMVRHLLYVHVLTTFIRTVSVD